MPAESSSQVSDDRGKRIGKLISELLHKRAQGIDIRDSQVVAEHPEFLPELRAELAKVRHITRALDLADDLPWQHAMQRLEHDWKQDRGSTRPLVRDVAAENSDSAPTESRWLLEFGNCEGEPRIGRYQIERLLGAGGFGRVFLARDDELKRRVAIKVPHRHHAIQLPDIEHYLAEARVVAALDHPAIVPVFDVGRIGEDSCYIVSKYISGCDLAKQLKSSQLPIDEAVRIIATIADALQCAHVRGIIHRDIKPANILLDVEGHPYVTDFGLAVREEQSCEPCLTAAGTPAYMSPEQARGEAHRIDARSDIFSLGVVLYELITGRRPFAGESRSGLLEQVVNAEVLAPRAINPGVPHELERICLKMLAKRASDRYATCMELRSDLRHWLGEWRRVAPGPHDPRLEQPSATATRESRPRVVPKGLRAFDADDADFFLQLLPGARDRDGIPESIRHWKLAIEKFDAEETFSVGVLYGPSGSGKSSFIRAGLLPRLRPEIEPIYLEATPEDTEQRLARRLAKKFPELTATGDLASSLAAVRRGRGPAMGRKLLVVVDQFEQWLHGKAESDRRSLVHALRHCDGERLQCLLLVRDDFWLALSRFMGELEIDLVQGHNVALVDLFDPAHARRVLMEFGRAYGQLPENLAHVSPEQAAFLDHAVRGLCEDHKIVPVRLALFAEMVKGRTWSEQTLAELGGAAGVGIRFLEETFSARTANPQNRMHERAARAVLSALLPDPGSPIKGHFRSYPALLDLSGYGFQPRAFKELMRILDSETRLLTPTDPATGDPMSVASSPGERYYQLTHDYLVPSLREWLTREQRKTSQGRTFLRLAERTRMWESHPETRQLPSLWEWLLIRALTRSSRWTEGQRKMMRAAGRRHAWALSSLLGMLLAFLVVGSELTTFARNMLLRVRASTATAWLAVGQGEAIWPLLVHSPNPSLRTRLIHGLSPIVINPDELIAEAAQQEEVSIRRALILAAGEMAGDSYRDGSRLDARQPGITPDSARQLADFYEHDQDPGVRAAAEWAMHRFGRDDELARSASRAAATGAGRRWYRTSGGHTMIVIAGPAQFAMGSPPTERGRSPNERLHSSGIPRSFSIASHETTVGQMLAFLREDRDTTRVAVHDFQLVLYSAQPQVTWYQAAAYCNWLSQREQIPRDEWCYVPNAEGKYAAGMSIVADYENRRGYRLPTEAEWEYACRAGSSTAYFFGDDASYLDRYALLHPSATLPLAVGSKKPNDFGLFDTLGNLAEWCQDRYVMDPTARSESGSAQQLKVDDGQERAVRGGSYANAAIQLRCASRRGQLTGVADPAIGFRIARSYP